MSPRGFTIAFALTIACSSSGRSYQHAQVAHLGFDIPSDWHRTDTNRRDLVTSVWTPDDNDHKESITIIRSDRAGAVANAGAGTVEKLLTGAQAPGARVSPVQVFVTAQGLSGARLDADYTPPGLRSTYHRVHVVLIDGGSLIHVMYTAKSPDEALQVFNQVLGTLREEAQS